MKFSKNVIKWENVLSIPIILYLINGIIKADSNLIIIAILQSIVIYITSYLIIKETRKETQKKGLLRAVRDFITLK